MPLVIEQAIGENDTSLNYEDYEDLELEEFDELSQELRELIDQHEAVDNALQVVRANRERIRYTQENNGSLEDSQELMRLSLESALGDPDYVPKTLDDASLASLESRLEVSLENIFEAMGHTIASIWNSLRKNAEKFEAKRKELQKRLQALDESANDQQITISKTRAARLTKSNKIAPTKLAEQISDSNEIIETFAQSYYDYAYRLYNQIADGQKELEKIADEDDKTKEKVLKEQWDSVSEIIDNHVKQVKRKTGEGKLLGKYRILTYSFSEYRAKLDNGKTKPLPEAVIVRTEKVSISTRKVDIPEKNHLEATLEQLGDTIKFIAQAQDHIAKIEKSMNKAAKQAKLSGDSPKVRRIVLPTSGERFGGYLLRFALLYFGDGFKRQMRHTMNGLRELINYEVGLTRATLSFCEKCIKASEKR